MKKFALALSLLFVLLAGWSLAAGGGASDPLISLSYLEGEFTDKVSARVDKLLDQSDEDLLNTAENLLDEWDEETGHVFMTGPATHVFDGEYDI